MQTGRIGGVTLTGENRSTQEKTCQSATLSTSNAIENCLELKPVLRGDRSATTRKAHIRTWYPLNTSPEFYRRITCRIST